MSKLAHSHQPTMDLIDAKRLFSESYPNSFAWQDCWKRWHICNRRMHGDTVGTGKTELAAWLDAIRSHDMNLDRSSEEK